MILPLMENLLSQSPLVGFIAVIVVAITVALVLFRRPLLTDSKSKAQEDKILLRKLLEGFGLEIPEELREQEGSVIKSIK